MDESSKAKEESTYMSNCDHFAFSYTNPEFIFTTNQSWRFTVGNVILRYVSWYDDSMPAI